MFSLSLSLIVITVRNAHSYYRYVLGQGAHIYLVNVMTFYVQIILWFGLTYFYLWAIAPSVFSYDVATVTPTLTMLPARTKFDFILFSAFQSVNGNYYRVHANSIWVSLLAYFQTLFTIALIALFIASYVNQQINNRRA